MVRVRCIYRPFYDDIELRRRITFGEEFEIAEDRAKYLAKCNAVEIIGKVEQPIKLEADDVKVIAEEVNKAVKKTPKKTNKK